MQTHYRWLAVIVVLVLVAGWMTLQDTEICIDSTGDSDCLDTDLGDINREIAFQLGLDLQGGIRVLLEADVPVEDLRPGDMEAVTQVISNRVDALGVTEPLIQQSGSNRIIVELPGISDPQAAVATIRETGLLEFVDFGRNPPAVGTKVVTDCWDTGGVCLQGGESEAAPEATAEPEGEGEETAAEGETAGTEEEEEEPAQLSPEGTPYHTVMTGRDLKDAGAAPPDTQRGMTNWYVIMEFTPEGRETFAQHTGAHVNEILGIVLDGRVISTPQINERIDSDSSMITGDFTRQEATSLAIQLRYGALPVPLTVESIQAIGPTLGAVSVERSVRAGVIGIVVVLIFMLVYYRLPGVAADLALLVFAVINLALYRLIPVTLTLPAITGFLISVGTAVDGNILIFERLKEELRAGRSTMAAFRFGFSRALPAIIDSNISTILICVILYWFGSQFGASAVRGFALTLAMGLAINLFTAIIVTRTFLAIFLHFGLEQIESRPWLLGV